MQRYMKFMIAGIVLIIFTMIFGWMLFPMVLKMKTHSQVQLKRGSAMRDMWSKIPFPLEFRVYLFNVTNPDEVKEGQKPILKQVGPYFFEEYHEKVDFIDNEEEDSVEYRVKNKFIFKKELSKGLTGDEELTLPHLFILAMVLTANKEKPSMLPVLGKAINSIFKKPTNVFMKMRAMDFMFDGLYIDCNVEDFPGTAVCSQLATADGLVKDGETGYRFSIFGAKNDTPASSKLRILRGVKNLKDVGTVIEYDGKKNISKWNNEVCDTFRGTDGYIFHPFFYADEDVVSFAPDLCRSLSASFQEKTKLSGVSLNRYSIVFGDPNDDPGKCYCEAPDKCMKKGVIDLYKCAGIPLVASHPHFYMAHEDYTNGVSGLKPTQEEHGLVLDFEPMSGSPLHARKRLQFNIMLQKIEKIKIMKNLPEVLLPLFWIEEGVIIPDAFVKQIKTGHKIVTIVSVIKWLMIVAGLGLVGVAGFLYYKKMQEMKVKITEVKKTINSAEQKASSVLDIKTLQSAAGVPPSID